MRDFPDIVINAIKTCFYGKIINAWCNLNASTKFLCIVLQVNTTFDKPVIWISEMRLAPFAATTLAYLALRIKLLCDMGVRMGPS